MEENNNIFLAGGDVLVYLAEPMHKKCSTKFVWGHPFSIYVSYDEFFILPFPSTHLHTFWMTPSFPLSRTYLMDGLFLNQKTNKNIRISYSQKYKHSIKNILYEKIKESGLPEL